MSVEAVAQPSRPAPRWPWFLALGCLLVVFLLVGAGLTIFYLFVGFMKSSEVYQMAWKQVRADPQVIAALGQPVEEGWFVSGNVSIVNAGGHASLAFSISGPKGKAVVRTRATRSAGVWKLDSLQVQAQGQPQPLILVPSAPASGPPLPAEQPPANAPPR